LIELGNEELLAGNIVEKFINTTYSIAKDLSITFSTEIRKRMQKLNNQSFMVSHLIKIITMN